MVKGFQQSIAIQRDLIERLKEQTLRSIQAGDKLYENPQIEPTLGPAAARSAISTAMVSPLVKMTMVEEPLTSVIQKDGSEDVCRVNDSENDYQIGQQAADSDQLTPHDSPTEIQIQTCPRDNESEQLSLDGPF